MQIRDPLQFPLDVNRLSRVQSAKKPTCETASEGTAARLS